MFNNIRNHMLFSVVIIFFCLNFTSTIAGDGYDGYYNHISTWPNQKDTFYAEDIQGLAHSDDAWFITKSGEAEGAVLYKIDVTEYLDNPQIKASTTPGLSGLAQLGYTEYKAMDSRKYPADNGIWYILIGVKGSSGVGLAVYDENLVFKGVVNVGVAGVPQPSSPSWCAIDNAGKVYFPVNNTSNLNRYQFDWDALALSGSVSLQFDATIDLKDSDGSPLIMDQHQGGDFTPEGDKLFIVTGFWGISSAPHGIHVFDAPTASSTVFTRIRKSAQSGLFRYNYAPSFPDHEEPEGLTFWDLTDGRAPNIDGELHVLLLDNDVDVWPVVDDDDIYIIHYTKGIYVDGTFTGSSNGDPTSPDKTVTDAVNRAFEDMEIRIKGGSYPESLTISKRLRLVSDGGIVRIGN